MICKSRMVADGWLDRRYSGILWNEKAGQKPAMTDRKIRKIRKDRKDRTRQASMASDLFSRPRFMSSRPSPFCHLDQAYSKTFPRNTSSFFYFFEVGIAAAIYDMRRLQYGRCVELREKALLAPDCCQSCLRMMLIL